MNLPVVTTPEAEAQISAIDDWWRKNRRASPDLFLEELSNAFEILARAPHIGRGYRRSHRFLVRVVSCCAPPGITCTTFHANKK